MPQRLLRNRQTLVHWVQWTTSLGWAMGLLYLLTMQHHGHYPTEYKFLTVVTGMLMLVVYQSVGVFRRYGTRTSSAWRLARAWGMVLGALLAIAFLTETSAEFSRDVIGAWAAIALFGQLVLYFSTQSLSNLWQQHVQVAMPALVVGSGHTARHLAESINRNPFLPDHVEGIVDEPIHSRHWRSKDVPVVGTLAQLPELVERLGIDRVYVAMPVERSAEVATIQRELLVRNVDIVWAPDIFSFNLLNPCIHEVAGVPLVSLSESPLHSSARALMKSVMDRVIATGVLLVAAPLMLAVAAAIKLTSTGPVLFKQPRHGWDGSVFEVWKFRSMYMHQEEGGVTQASRDDPRVTPVGRFIRRTSIDELPQLFNVLGGSMSLVGPRPHAVLHNLEYAPQVRAYMARHRVKPGITGWAQVHGYRGETDCVEKMQQRVRFDLDYINNCSLRMDLWILLLTPLALCSRNAY